MLQHKSSLKDMTLAQAHDRKIATRKTTATTSIYYNLFPLGPQRKLTADITLAYHNMLAMQHLYKVKVLIG